MTAIPLELRAVYKGDSAKRGLTDLANTVKQVNDEAEDTAEVFGVKVPKAMQTTIVRAGATVAAFGLVAKGIDAITMAGRKLGQENIAFDTMFPQGADRRITEIAIAYSQSGKEVEATAIRLARSTGEIRESLDNVGLVYETASRWGLSFAESQTAVAAAIKNNRAELEKLLPQLKSLDGTALEVLRGAGAGNPRANVGGGVFGAFGNLFSAGRDRLVGTLDSSRSYNNLEFVVNWAAEQLRNGGQDDYRLSVGRGAVERFGTGPQLADWEVAALRAEEEERRARLREEAAERARRQRQARRDIIGFLGNDPSGDRGFRSRTSAAAIQPYNPLLGLLPGAKLVRGRAADISASRFDEKFNPERVRELRSELDAMVDEDVARLGDIATGLESVFANAFNTAIEGGNAFKQVLDDLVAGSLQSLVRMLAQLAAGAFTGGGSGIAASALQFVTGEGGTDLAARSGGLVNTYQTGGFWRKQRRG